MGTIRPFGKPKKYAPLIWDIMGPDERPCFRDIPAMPKDTDMAERAYHEAFRKRLRAIREELDWSQSEMADALGIPLENYKKYERRSKFPPHLLDRLALVTHRNIEYIVTGRGPNIRVVRARTAT